MAVTSSLPFTGRNALARASVSLDVATKTDGFPLSVWAQGSQLASIAGGTSRRPKNFRNQCIAGAGIIRNPQSKIRNGIQPLFSDIAFHRSPSGFFRRHREM